MDWTKTTARRDEKQSLEIWCASYKRFDREIWAWNMTAVKYCDLTHWGRVTHIYVRKLASIVSDNGLLPGRRQAIIWTNAGILLIGPLGTNFSKILIKIHTFSFKKMHLKMSSGKWRPFCLGLNVLKALTRHGIRKRWHPILSLCELWVVWWDMHPHGSILRNILKLLKAGVHIANWKINKNDTVKPLI